MTTYTPYAEKVGHTQIENSLIDYVMPVLEPSAWVAICFIIRKTRGWQKESDKLSLTQLEKGTGLSRGTVIKVVQSLEKGGHIIVNRSHLEINEFNLNPDFIIDPSAEKPKTNRGGRRIKGQFKDCTSSNIELSDSSNIEHTKENLIKENNILGISTESLLVEEDLLSKPYSELQELCKSLGKDGHLVLVNYWYQLTGTKSPKLERSGQPTTAAKKFKANYATFLKDKTFLDDVFPALRDYALNIVPIKKDWPTLEWFLGTGKNNNGPGWKRVAEKQAWLYRPDEGKNGVTNKPDVKPLYYTP